MAAGDLDGDGDTDVVTSIYGSPSIRMRQADGTYTEAIRFRVATFDLVIGDVDGDGRPDVVGTTGSDVRVFHNDPVGLARHHAHRDPPPGVGYRRRSARRRRPRRTHRRHRPHPQQRRVVLGRHVPSGRRRHAGGADEHAAAQLQRDAGSRRRDRRRDPGSGHVRNGRERERLGPSRTARWWFRGTADDVHRRHQPDGQTGRAGHRRPRRGRPGRRSRHDEKWRRRPPQRDGADRGDLAGTLGSKHLAGRLQHERAHGDDADRHVRPRGCPVVGDRVDGRAPRRAQRCARPRHGHLRRVRAHGDGQADLAASTRTSPTGSRSRA